MRRTDRHGGLATSRQVLAVVLKPAPPIIWAVSSITIYYLLVEYSMNEKTKNLQAAPGWLTSSSQCILGVFVRIWAISKPEQCLALRQMREHCG